MIIKTHSQVRCRVGNTCGSGVIVGSIGNKQYILTNAHVVGTELGREVTVESFWHDSTRPRRQTGRIVAVGFRRGVSLDYAFVEVDPIPGSISMPISKTGRCNEDNAYTGGSPRCEWTKFSEIHFIDDNIRRQVYEWQPNAIGGQSGSGVIDRHSQRVTSLLTWTIEGNGAGQNTRIIWEHLMNQVSTEPEVLPTSAQPACENPQHCDDGVVAVQDFDPERLFIDCSDAPEPPVDPGPPQMDPMERIVTLSNMIEEIAKAQQTGDPIDMNAFDWIGLLRLLLEFFLNNNPNNDLT